MCGRYALSRSVRELADLFEAPPPEFDFAPSANIAPGREIPVVVAARPPGGRRLEKRRWGLVPSWAKEIAIGGRLINARVETVRLKPAFRAAFRERRCLIPADGFYEWHGPPGRKQPYFFHRPSGAPLAFAGLYENWRGGAPTPGADAYLSCAILTREASASVREIHDRMPVILKPEYYDAWLDPDNTDPAALERILREGCITELSRHAVSRRVNRVENDDRRLTEPIAEDPLPPAGGGR